MNIDIFRLWKWKADGTLYPALSLLIDLQILIEYQPKKIMPNPQVHTHMKDYKIQHSSMYVAPF